MSRSKVKQSRQIEPSYIKMRAEMLCSPAWQALTMPARRVIERLIIEHCQHAGKNNGYLICTYQNFVEFGIRRQSIASAIGQTVSLGFVEVTQRGHRSPDHNWPSRYRLTFLATVGAEATDDWKHFAATKKPRKMQKPSGKNAASTGNENAPSTGCGYAPPGGPRYWVQKCTSYLDATHLQGAALGGDCNGDRTSATPDGVGDVACKVPGLEWSTPTLTEVTVTPTAYAALSHLPRCTLGPVRAFRLEPSEA